MIHPILGSSEFANNIIADSDQKAKEALRLIFKISDLSSRRIFCQIAVKKMSYSGADVTRFFGINTSDVNRLAVSDECQR